MGAEQLSHNLFRLVVAPFQAYLWRDADGVTLIDTGTADAGSAIAAALDEIGLAPPDIDRVVLTHFHDDHVGAAAEIREWGDIEVVAHEADAPIISGVEPRPEPNLTEGERSLQARVAPALPPAPPVTVDRTVTDGDVLDFGRGAEVLAVPGHTQGSIALHLPAHGVLLTGDTVAEHGGRVIPGVFNLDREQTLASMRRLAGLNITIAAFGHGEPILEQASERLRRAVAAAGG